MPQQSDELGHIGGVDLESTFPLYVQCRNDSRAPTTPDSAPTYRIYAPGGGAAILTGSMGAADVDSQTGFRYVGIACTAANQFTSGDNFTVRVEYAISGAAKAVKGELLVR
jgi:hypothetical protein